MLLVGDICGNFPEEPKVRMVKTRSMVAQQDKGTRIDSQEASVSDGACPETQRVVVLEQKIQGLMASKQLLMEQNREIIQQL